MVARSEMIWIRTDEEAGDRVDAEQLDEDRARLLEIPASGRASIYDVVRFDPESEVLRDGRSTYQMREIVEPSGYQGYLCWALLHKPQEFAAWRGRMEESGIVVQPGEWATTSQVRVLFLALPPSVGALRALAFFNRHAQQAEVICPLLAAHADDLDRAKSDLERAVAWGAPDAELTYAVAEAFEEMKRWDESMAFWERLAHILPELAEARERLAISYARLEVFPLAATEFDRAAHLTDDPEKRRRLEGARDLMWERSRL
jgi:tetratricopeptide (TPR) repeat protein